MPLFKPSVSGLKDKRDIAGLTQLLKDKTSRTRREAVQALGELGDARAVSAIVDLLLVDEQDLGEKIPAARSLGKIGDEKAVDALKRAMVASQKREHDLIEVTRAAPVRQYRDGFYVNRIASDEFELRTAIAHALAEIATVNALEALFEMLAVEKGAMEHSVRGKVRECIDATIKKIGGAAVLLLCTQLTRPSIEGRRVAAQTLGEFAVAQSIDALINAASNETENFDVRSAALASLGNIGDAGTLARVDDLAVSTSNPIIAREARQCAISIRQRLGLPFITGFGSRNPPVR